MSSPAGQGEAAALNQLDEIEQTIPALRRYAGALVRDRDAADDLVQDALERILSRRGTWRGDGSFRAWMFRILLNLSRDGHRYRQVRAHLSVVPDTQPEPARSGGQEAHMELVEVHAAMGRLPPDQRAALLLVALEGMSLAEAASVMEVPEGTLVSRLGRARAALRDMTGHGAATPVPLRRDAGIR